MKVAVSSVRSTTSTTLVVVAFLSCASANPLSSFTSRLLQKVSGVPDNIFHCNHRQDSQWLDDDNVDCLEDEGRLWDTDRLDPNNPPDRCSDFNYDNFGDTQDDWGGWYEPCVLWEMMYGELQPTAAPSRFLTVAPSPAPSTVAPTSVAPTTGPTASPTLLPTATPSTIDLSTMAKVMIAPFQLTLVVPSGGSSLRRASSLQVDRDEWKELTELHLRNQQAAARMVQLVFVAEPIVTQDSNKSVMISQIFRGVVYYDDASTTANVDSMVASSFEVPAFLSDFTLLLQQAEDPVLSSTRNVLYAVIPTNTGSNSSSVNVWDGVFIAGCVVVVAGIVFLGFVMYKRWRHVEDCEEEEQDDTDADKSIKEVDRTMDESFQDEIDPRGWE